MKQKILFISIALIGIILGSVYRLPAEEVSITSDARPLFLKQPETAIALPGAEKLIGRAETPGLMKNDNITTPSGRMKIFKIEGNVKVKASGMRKWEPAFEGAILTKGDSIKTGKNSWAEIELDEGRINVLRIKEKTRVVFTEPEYIRIKLLKGEVRTLIEGLKRASNFEIRTPTAICGARGTGWDTMTDGRISRVDTFEHSVFFNRLSAGGAVLQKTIIESGKRGIMMDRNSRITIKRLPEERIKRWNGWRESLPSRIGSEERISPKKEAEGTAGRQVSKESSKEESKSKEKRTDKDKNKAQELNGTSYVSANTEAYSNVSHKMGRLDKKVDIEGADEIGGDDLVKELLEKAKSIEEARRRVVKVEGPLLEERGKLENARERSGKFEKIQYRTKVMENKAEKLEKIQQKSEKLEKIQQRSEKLEKIQEKSEKLEKIQQRSEKLEKIQEKAEKIEKIQEKAEKIEKIQQKAEKIEKIQEKSKKTERAEKRTERKEKIKRGRDD